MSPLAPTLDRIQQCAQVREVFDLLGHGCVAFYPRLAELTGSVTAALLLGQCLYWTHNVLQQQPQRDGWFWKTAAEWQRETGLSRREQESARRRLRAQGLLAEHRRGMPAKRWFRVDLAALRQRLDRIPGVRGGGSSAGDKLDLAQRLGPPVVYWRRLHEVTGSVTAALYLSRALFWQRVALREPQPQGPWFHRPIFQSQQVLRLGRRQQEHARANLRALGFLEERVVPGLPPRLMTRLELEALAERLAAPDAAATTPVPGVPQPECSHPAVGSAGLLPTLMHESAKQACTKAPTMPGAIVHSLYRRDYYKETPTDAPTERWRDSGPSLPAPGGGGVLQFPNCVLPAEQPVLAQIVNRCPEQAQTILDELAGQVQNPARRVAIGNPLAYARALTQRALAGAFTPEAALQVAAARERRRAEELRQQAERAERQRQQAEADDPRQRAAAEAVRVECLARIRTLLAPARCRPGVHA